MKTPVTIIVLLVWFLLPILVWNDPHPLTLKILFTFSWMFMTLVIMMGIGAKKTQTLPDVWHKKIVKATKQNLTCFIFYYNNEAYISRWDKGKWEEPHAIQEI